MYEFPSDRQNIAAVVIVLGAGLCVSPPIAGEQELSFTIRDEETDCKAAEIAAVAGESKASAVRRAVRERHERLRLEGQLPIVVEAWLRPLDPRAGR